MRKEGIITLLSGLCLCFALAGCDSSGSSEEAYEIFKENVPVEYEDDNGDIYLHTWNGKPAENCPYGPAKQIDVAGPYDFSECYGYLNKADAVYYEGLFDEYLKVFDRSLKKVGDKWFADTKENFLCEIINIDKNYLKGIYTIKVTDLTTNAHGFYEYSDYFGLIFNYIDEPEASVANMKIIVIKNPKIISPILKIIQNIKRKQNRP